MTMLDCDIDQLGKPPTGGFAGDRRRQQSIRRPAMPRKTSSNYVETPPLKACDIPGVSTEFLAPGAMRCVEWIPG